MEAYVEDTNKQDEVEKFNYEFWCIFGKEMKSQIRCY